VSESFRSGAREPCAGLKRRSRSNWYGFRPGHLVERAKDGDETHLRHAHRASVERRSRPCGRPDRRGARSRGDDRGLRKSTASVPARVAASRAGSTPSRLCPGDAAGLAPRAGRHASAESAHGALPRRVRSGSMKMRGRRTSASASVADRGRPATREDSGRSENARGAARRDHSRPREADLAAQGDDHLRRRRRSRRTSGLVHLGSLALDPRRLRAADLDLRPGVASQEKGSAGRLERVAAADQAAGRRIRRGTTGPATVEDPRDSADDRAICG